MAKKVVKGKDLPDPDHIARHVPWTKLRKDADDNVLGVYGEAFMPRPADNSKLSVNWLEHFAGNHQTRIAETVKSFRAHREELGTKIGPKSAFAIGNVGKIKSICGDSSQAVKIVWSPTPGNPSHSLIRDMPADDQTLLEMLATEGIVELVRNSDIP